VRLAQNIRKDRQWKRWDAMTLLKYRLRDLKLARLHVTKGAHRIARQEAIVDRLITGTGNAELAVGLLARLHDRQRLQLNRVKWIQAMLGPKATGPQA
jgi:hypothetical protein